MDTTDNEPSTGATQHKGHFVTTHWSMVLRAGEELTQEGNRALEELCGAYWFPLYVYARRRGAGKEDAEDLTQSFFFKVLQGRWLAKIKPTGGRFRSYLLTSFQHFMRDEWQKSLASKRNGGMLLPLELCQAEDRYCHEPGPECSADQLFTRRWAFEVLDKAIESLRRESVEEGKGTLFDLLLPCLTEAPGDGFYESAAAKAGVSAGAVSVSAHRLRSRYRRRVREVIARTVASPMEVEDELRVLMGALRSGPLI